MFNDCHLWQFGFKPIVEVRKLFLNGIEKVVAFISVPLKKLSHDSTVNNPVIRGNRPRRNTNSEGMASEN